MTGYIKDLRTLVRDENYKSKLSQPIKVGVVGFSDESYIDKDHGDKTVTAYLEQGIKDLGLETDNIIIVSGLTNLGVPRIAYQYATKNGIKTVGYSAMEAKEYDCYPVDEEIIVGDRFGSESKSFLNYIDCLIKIGGGPQSISEYSSFKKPKVEYSLDKGTYGAVKFSEDSQKILQDLCERLELPNIVPPKDLHMTLLYSRKECSNYIPRGSISEEVFPTAFKVFETHDNKRALVLLCDSPYARMRHNDLMDEHKATYDWSEYHPHISLSMDIGDMTTPVFEPLPDLEIVEEYVEELKLDWKSSEK
jgi:hypothetical protein